MPILDDIIFMEIMRGCCLKSFWRFLTEFCFCLKPFQLPFNDSFSHYILLLLNPVNNGKGMINIIKFLLNSTLNYFFIKNFFFQIYIIEIFPHIFHINLFLKWYSQTKGELHKRPNKFNGSFEIWMKLKFFAWSDGRLTRDECYNVFIFILLPFAKVFH